MDSMILLEKLTAAFPGTQQPRARGAWHPAISLPDHDDAFVCPPLKAIEVDDFLSSPIVVISASGAVGKTALAKYISAKKRCYLWDLSKIKLGDNSFIGTLAQCFGTENLGDILAGLRTGAAGFVIDAVDEAGILSGWPSLQAFLDELVVCTKGAARPCLILLARSETATRACRHLRGRLNGRGLCSLFEIDYFNYAEARKFVDLQSERIAREQFAQPDCPVSPEWAQDAIFNAIYKAFSVEPENAWSDSRFKKFFGYAPVLQWISGYISLSLNHQAKQQRSGGWDGSQNGAKIASFIMTELLLREQDKIISALKEKKLPQVQGWAGWDRVYAPDEQLRRAYLFATGAPEATQMPAHLSEMPPALIGPYQQCLETFLPQHPFLKGRSFSGPVFCAFVLANLLKSSDIPLRVNARSYIDANRSVDTPLLVNFFLSDGKETSNLFGCGFH